MKWWDCSWLSMRPDREIVATLTTSRSANASSSWISLKQVLFCWRDWLQMTIIISLLTKLPLILQTMRTRTSLATFWGTLTLILQTQMPRRRELFIWELFCQEKWEIGSTSNSSRRITIPICSLLLVESRTRLAREIPLPTVPVYGPMVSWTLTLPMIVSSEITSNGQL